MEREHPSKIWSRLRYGEMVDKSVKEALTVLSGTHQKDIAAPGVAVAAVDDFTIEVQVHRIRLRNTYSHAVGKTYYAPDDVVGLLEFRRYTDGKFEGDVVFSVYVSREGMASFNGGSNSLDINLTELDDPAAVSVRGAFKEEMAYVADAMLRRL